MASLATVMFLIDRSGTGDPAASYSYRVFDWMLACAMTFPLQGSPGFIHTGFVLL